MGYERSLLRDVIMGRGDKTEQKTCLIHGHEGAAAGTQHVGKSLCIPSHCTKARAEQKGEVQLLKGGRRQKIQGRGVELDQKMRWIDRQKAHLGCRRTCWTSSDYTMGKLARQVNVV